VHYIVKKWKNGKIETVSC